MNKYKSTNKIIDTNFLDTYSIENVSYSSDDFICSPLKCHYPSYIPNDSYKSSKCIRIIKHTVPDSNNNNINIKKI